MRRYPGPRVARIEIEQLDPHCIRRDSQHGTAMGFYFVQYTRRLCHLARRERDHCFLHFFDQRVLFKEFGDLGFCQRQGHGSASHENFSRVA